jgi:hypothetical protein
MEGQQYACRRTRRITWVGLLECHAWVRETTNATVASEIVVKGAIFLDNDHYVLNIRQLSARWRGRWSWRNFDRAAAAAMQNQRSQLCSSTGCAEL